ncbi:MAG: hypothetical protein Q8N23_32745 [Archangium sp.]|nr:hypothetical protein [Archangium sp.]MDP3157483.1 hypothetical protein [Archangium sp.]MDP3572770.1 hypothetical protein [Archangium sp.]
MAPLVALAILAASPVEMRQDSDLEFAVDEAFQQDGGVQYFYELAEPGPQPSSALTRFRAMDPESTLDDPYVVVMSRLVYTVERDISFFTEARARDVSYLQQVAPDMGVRLEPDGTFRVNRTPSNRFKLTWFEEPVAGKAPAMTAFFGLLPQGAKPASVVLQKNFDFARVMGWRTGERAITYTAHFAIAPGRTRVVVCSMSLMHHLPPFFLGGRGRVFRESVDGAASLIGQLRAWTEE